MRTIKFRGKAHGRWIYGGLVYSDNIEPAIYFEVGNKVYKRIDWAYVDPATVGQFTGLLDKNGKKIFEGDVIKCGMKLYVCEFIEGGFEFRDLSDRKIILKAIVNDSCIIGNIHDNPELINK